MIRSLLFICFLSFLFSAETLSDKYLNSIDVDNHLGNTLSGSINIIDQDNNTIEINDKYLRIPKLFSNQNNKNISKHEIKEALTFNKNLLIENFIAPNRLRLPLSRNILEKYYD